MGQAWNKATQTRQAHPPCYRTLPHRDRYTHLPQANARNACPSLSPRARTCLSESGCGGAGACWWVNTCLLWVLYVEGMRMSLTRDGVRNALGSRLTQQESRERDQRPRRPATHTLRRQWLVRGTWSRGEEIEQEQCKQRKNRSSLSGRAARGLRALDFKCVFEMSFKFFLLAT